jgi:type I restriction enzyme, S subunit
VAVFARLISEQPVVPATTAPAKWGVTSASLLSRYDYRLEASTYLSDGYGRRIALESRPAGWRRLEKWAKVWQPGRLTGVIVEPQDGIPYLAPGQIFEARPRARRFLSARKTIGIDACFVDPRTILVTRSGTVGKSTMAYDAHVDCVFSDDLLRVIAYRPEDSGWIYAFSRTGYFRSMAVSSQYGHVVKHLEVAHLSALPVIEPTDSARDEVHDLIAGAFDLRDEAIKLTKSAESEYSTALGLTDLPPAGLGFAVRMSTLANGRRRLDGHFHQPGVSALERTMEATSRQVTTLGDISVEIRLPGRFKRSFGDSGTTYRSAEELFDLNPPITKRIYAAQVEDADEYMLHPGWLAMACSGQLYGLNGSVVLLNSRHSGVFASHDLIRIQPDEAVIRSGYLLTVLGHPTLGRPAVIRNGYGTSIPHLDDGDVSRIQIPRFDESVEDGIADAAEEAARLRAVADDMEDEGIAIVDAALKSFLRVT